MVDGMEIIVPAIVIVGCNRIDSFKRLLDSIFNAKYQRKDIPLVISIDYSEKAETLRSIAETKNWIYGKKRVIVQEKNIGLKKHIIKCGDLSEEYGAVIVLEDDLFVSDGFYSYVFQAVNRYKDDDKVAGISLYTHSWNGFARKEFIPQKNSYDAFWGQFSISWGQCWTKESWQKFKRWLKLHDNGLLPKVHLPREIESYGEQSWGKYFAYYLVDNDLYYIIPYVAFSTNFSEPGVHTKIGDSTYQVRMAEGNDFQFRLPDFNEAIKYDMFFERVITEDLFVENINLKDVCFDLYGLKWDFHGRDYIAATRICRARNPLLSFDIRLRPIEQNVIRNISGNGINLYENNNLTVRDFKTTKHVKQVVYDFYNHSVELSMKYVFARSQGYIWNKFIAIYRRICRVMKSWK